ncbi:MAG: glycosyl hydrolase family 18 protein [Ignavibacteriales bacterium]
MTARNTGVRRLNWALRGAVLAAVTIATFVLNGVAVAPQVAAAPRLEVMAYCPVDYPGDSVAYDSLKANWASVDTAALFQFTLDWSGRVLGSGDARYSKLAKEKGFNLDPVVHNFVSGKFNAEMVRSSLATLEGRSKAAGAIASLVLDNGYSGVNIDFEGLTPDLRDAFSLFIKNLAGRLHAKNRTVSVAVPAKTRDNPSDSWSGAYDYRALAQEADRLMIMAYDEHWAGGSPGPIASIEWVKQVVEYAVTAAPANKILLGVPQYSYDWPTAGGPARYMSTPAAMRIAAQTGAEVLWDGTAQAPHFYYWQGREQHHVFMENSYSLAFKIGVARNKGLAGIAIWRMGYEDPRTWEIINSYR